MKTLLLTGTILATLAIPVLGAPALAAEALAANAVSHPGSASGATEPADGLRAFSGPAPATRNALDRQIEAWRERIAAYEAAIARTPTEAGRANAAALAQALGEVERRRADLDHVAPDSYTEVRSAMNQALEDMDIVWDAVAQTT